MFGSRQQKAFFSSPSRSDRYWGPQASYPKATRGSFLGINRSERKADHSSQSRICETLPSRGVKLQNKGKIIRGAQLSTTPFRRMREWRYSCMHSQPWQQMEGTIYLYLLMCQSNIKGHILHHILFQIRRLMEPGNSVSTVITLRVG